MSRQQTIDFARVAEAIEYTRENVNGQPTLDDIASKVCLSSADLQHLFTLWAGVNLQEFLQYSTTEYAKKVLKESSLSDIVNNESGVFAIDKFVKIEAITPFECKNLSINYSFSDSLFGEIIVASTYKGVCYMAFADNKTVALTNLHENFPNAQYHQISDDFQQNAISSLTHDFNNRIEIRLHLKGTDFQLKVWEVLLKIPLGELTTYGNIASKLNNPNASRAVGTAIGSNPVSLLIPCHRVIRSSGELGGYHWGLTRKVAIIGWEAVKKRAHKLLT